jgi:hypothetical protein
MPPKVLTVTAQAAMFSAISTIVAQGITMWKHQVITSALHDLSPSHLLTIDIEVFFD